jgi:Fur family ferric uptake transcriptional regulator
MDNISSIKKRNTKQKQIIVEFLKSNQDKHLTADEIVDKLKVSNLKVSKATVYRFLNNLSEDGTIRKYLLSENLSNCYQYVKNLKECNKHYHLICDSCGKVLHFEDVDMEKIQKRILESSKFKIDLQRVLFYGKCKACISVGG